jgi:hypothetical protein
MGNANIVESGLHPKPPPTLETRVLAHTEDICNAFMAAVRASLARIKDAELAAIARLETYAPTERLLDRHEAAAYLKLRVRQLDVLTRPGSTQIPFNRIGSLKRFRKPALDQWLADTEVTKKAVKL